MDGFLTKSLWTKDSEGMYDLCTSTDNRENIFTDKQLVTDRHQLIVPRCRLNTCDRRAFSIAGPTVWFSLPDELRDTACGSGSFKQFLKTILFSLY